MLAVVPVRDGSLPAGGAEAAAECAGRALLIGTGTELAAAELGAGDVRLLELAAGTGPATSTAALGAPPRRRRHRAAGQSRRA